MKKRSVSRAISRHRKTYEFQLPYFKQGDDLGHFLREGLSPTEALLANAENLRGAAAMCEELAKRLQGITVKIDADTHTIRVTGPVAKLRALAEGEDALLQVPLEERAGWS